MNAYRRKALKLIITKLEELESLASEIKEELQEVTDDEQEAYYNMPESLQSSDRGEQMSEYIDGMQQVCDILDSIDVNELTATLEEI